jgi:hypothetical protein
MSPLLKKFMISNLVTMLIIAATTAILFMTILKDYFHWLIPVILLSSLIINLITFRVILGRKDSKLNIQSAIAKSFFIKFSSYIFLAVLVIFSKSPKPVMAALLAFLFSLYIIFSILEVKAFSEYARKGEK